MQLNLAAASDSVLKGRAMELLVHGVLPFEKWVHVFANPNFVSWPGLRAKAFSVWFPTMVDYLQGDMERAAIEKELGLRKVDIVPVPELSSLLARHFSDVLCLYTVDEQTFLRDRRLQNVHGRLQINMYEEVDFVVFQPSRRRLEKALLTAAQYRGIMGKYYPNLPVVSAELIDRLLYSTEFSRLSQLYLQRLQFGQHLVPLLSVLGIAAPAVVSSDA